MYNVPCRLCAYVIVLRSKGIHVYYMFQFIAGKLFGDLMIGGLVFISGYTHFIYYWKHGDFTWKRLATVRNA